MFKYILLQYSTYSIFCCTYSTYFYFIFLQYQKVWIIGDSYIRREEQHARETVGTNLALTAGVERFGRGGMTWSSLLPLFSSLVHKSMPPDTVIIYCGGNDLGTVKSLQLLRLMQDLQYLHMCFPQMKLILSTINQR